MNTQNNKELFRRLYEDIVTDGDLDECHEFVSEDVVEHEAVPGSAPGLEGFKQTIGGFRDSFPDMRVEVLDLIAENDKVVGRLRFTGSHQNQFLGVAPTQNQIEFESIDIIRFEDGMMVEHWGCSDMLSFMQQIEAVPGSSELFGA